MIAESFPILIHSLAERHHRNCLLTMSRECDLSYTTLWRWERGMSGSYDYFLVQRLCERYSLEPTDVWALIHRDTALRTRGKRIPLPDVSDRRRGPQPSVLSRERRTRVRLGLTAAITTVLSLLAPGRALPAVPDLRHTATVCGTSAAATYRTPPSVSIPRPTSATVDSSSASSVTSAFTRVVTSAL